MAKSKVMEEFFLNLVQYLTDYGIMTELIKQEFLTTTMEMVSKGDIRCPKKMVLEDMYTEMEVYMKETLKMIFLMEMVN